MVSQTKSLSHSRLFNLANLLIIFFMYTNFLNSQNIENFSDGRKEYIKTLNKSKNNSTGYPPSYGEAFAGIERYEFISDLQTELDYDNQTIKIIVTVVITNPDSDERDYGAGEFVNVWLDINGNGIFEEDEQVMDQMKLAKGTDIADTLTFMEVVNIPENAPPETWMRVVLGYGYDPKTIDSWYFGSSLTIPCELLIKMEGLHAPVLEITKSTSDLIGKINSPFNGTSEIELTMKDLKKPIDPYFDFYGSWGIGLGKDWDNGKLVKNGYINFPIRVNASMVIKYGVYRRSISYPLVADEAISKILKINARPDEIINLKIPTDFLTLADEGDNYIIKVTPFNTSLNILQRYHLGKLELTEPFVVSRDNYYVNSPQEVPVKKRVILVNENDWLNKKNQWFLAKLGLSLGTSALVSLVLLPAATAEGAILGSILTTKGLKFVVGKVPSVALSFYVSFSLPTPAGYQKGDVTRVWEWYLERYKWNESDKNYLNFRTDLFETERVYRPEYNIAGDYIKHVRISDYTTGRTPEGHLYRKEWPYARYPFGIGLVYRAIESPNHIPEALLESFVHKPHEISIVNPQKTKTNYSTSNHSFSDYGWDMDNNNLFDYLTIEISLDANVQGSYHIAGTLSHDDRMIAAGSDQYLLEVGNNNIKLNIQGEKISQNGIDGSYQFSIHTYDSEWNLIEFNENVYQTTIYQANQFEKPLIRYLRYLGDDVIDTDGNGKYDKLNFTTEIESDTAGTFIFYGYLKQDSSIISNFKQEFAVMTGTNNIEFSFPADDIKKSNLDGPYSLNGFYIADTNNVSIFFKDSIGISRPYNNIQFEYPYLVLGNDIEDIGIDNDGNGYFNILQIKTSATIEKSGKYYLSGSLADSTGNLITNINDSTNLFIGIQEIRFNFNGRHIYDNGIDGPYILKSLSISSAENNNSASVTPNVYRTESYQTDQFQPPNLYLTGSFNEESVDIDNDEIIEGLEIEANVKIVNAGTYSIFSTLMSSYRTSIASDVLTIDFLVGEGKITLSFNGETINRQKINGPYLVDVTIFDSEGNLISAYPNAYQTNQYEFNQFTAPEAFINDIYSDTGFDINDNNLFDSLFINVGVRINQAGHYSVSGDLVDTSGYKIDSDVSRTYLDAGEHSFKLSFDGIKIYRNGINGPYYLANLSMYDAGNSNWPLLSKRSVADTTKPYEYTEFENDTTSGPTEVKKIEVELPTEYILHQNYPNPFNPTTNINYSLPKSDRIENVLLEIYNTLGEKITTLVNTEQSPGNYSVEWNGRDDALREVTSGVYLIRLKTDSYTSVKKMIILR